jgi:hypothetical protein
LRAQDLMASLNSMPLLQHDPPTHKHFLCNVVLGRVGESFRTNRALAPFSPTPTSTNTTPSLIALHYESNGYFPLFLKDYKPE